MGRSGRCPARDPELHRHGNGSLRPNGDVLAVHQPGVADRDRRMQKPVLCPWSLSFQNASKGAHSSWRSSGVRYAYISAASSAAAALLFVSSLSAQQSSSPAAESWGHWRGPLQTGVAAGAAPVRWSDTSNIAWRVEIPGRGHSSPVIWGDRIFLTTAVPTGQKAAASDAAAGGGGRRGDGGAGPHEEHRFDVLALDRATGKTMWRQTAVTALPHEGYHATYGSFASNSPTTDGQRIYASFGSRGCSRST